MTDISKTFREKFSTALVADAAYRASVPLVAAAPGLNPIDRTMKITGPVITVQANNDLASIIAALHRASPGDAIVVSNHTADVALIGDLIAKEASRKGLAGIVVDGLIRDAVELIEIGLPVFCRGVYPVGPLKLPSNLKGKGELGIDLNFGEDSITAGDWVFGDADGILFIKSKNLPAVFEAAERSFRREKALENKLRSGTALGEMLAIESFLKKRESDPGADFNQHLAELQQAI